MQTAWQSAYERALQCWGALLPDQAALEGWTTQSPLLVMGSHTWNTPNEKGRLFCDGERQEEVFAAAEG